MRIILLGAPGAGKGTQSTRILAKYVIPYISTGDIFRKEVLKDTDFGKEIQRYIDKGLLVPDHITLEIIQELYEKKLVTYPRTDARVLSTAIAKEIGKNLNGLFKNFKDEEIHKYISKMIVQYFACILWSV